MRILFTLAGLLIVLFIVMKLSSQQVAALKPAATEGQAPPVNATQRVGDDVKKALEQGAAARASEAQSQ